jgi:gliding motility-associated-like protein
VVCDAGVPLPAICDTAVVVINVVPVNDPPVIVDGGGTPIDTTQATTYQDNPVVICLNVLDADGDPVDITAILSGPNNGTLSNVTDGDTCLTYTPDPGYLGGDTLVAVVCDPFGGCDTVVVIISVIPNQPPIAVDDTATVAGGGSVVIPNEANDSDPEGDPFTTTTATAGNGTVTINGNGTLTYVPDPGFCGTDTISYTICDTFGGCDSAIIVVTVQCPPIAVDDTASTNEDTPIIIPNQANDSDPNGDPFSTTSASAGHGTVTINGDGTLTYTPDPNYCGTDTITYTICDSTGLCDSAIIIVTVICVNDPPIANDDNGSVPQGGSVDVPVLGNDSDPEGDVLTVTSASADHGSVVINPDGTLTYTPDPDYCGPDTITYTVCDPEPLCDTGFVFITVECANTVLAVPEGFSPNGDGIGDTWVIQGLENYPGASVKIFNRYGNAVFEADPYRNDWDGTNTNSFSIGDQLPIGTYWYILDLKNGEEPQAGFIYLNR